MATKQQNILIIAVAVVISAGIWIFTTPKEPKQHFESRLFKVTNGWGYDVLVNDTIIIHQESIPVQSTRQAFLQKDQAQKAASLVIQKLKTSALPTLTKSDLEKILGPAETNNDRPNKME